MKKLLFTLFAVVATLHMRAQTVVDVVVDSPVHNTLETAVIAADLAGTLSGPGPFTVFAPTDNAFSALPDGVLNELLADPSGALTQILLYHVVNGSALSSGLSDGDQITTLFGQNLAITVNGNGVFINETVQVTTADIVATNGVVHVIDAVLVPTVWNAVKNSPIHGTLETAIDLANLEETLSTDGPFTLFAPTDNAFTAIPADVLQALLADPTGDLTNILLYHVTNGTALAASLLDGQEITMLNDGIVNVVINANGVFVNDAQVIVTDIPAINGVVHVIDAVLLPAADDNSVFDIIANSPDHNILEVAIGEAGLTTTLDEEAGPFTIFAPTDAAFNALPAGTIDALLADIPTLTAVLTYHVVGGNVLSTDLDNGQVVTTLNGGSVTVTINSNGVFINNAKVTVADLVGSNGVVHVIDAVLLPAEQGSTVYGIISTSEAHNTLQAAIDAAGLELALSGAGPFTVFAPTDDAFAALPAGTVDALLNDIPTLTAILNYHVVAATAYAATLTNGQTITTANGEDVNVTINANGVFINNAQVTVTDLVAENGIVHVINAVLLPPSDEALVQIIHNCADAAADTVDIYVGGELLLDNFTFRRASQFVPVPADTDVEVAVALANSQSAADAIFTTTINLPVGNHIAIANGIVSTTGYSPDPDFTLHTFSGAKFQADMTGMPEVLVYHGATDAPTVDVLVTAPAALTLVNNISYGEFDGYNAVALADYTVAIAPEAGSPVLASFLAPLQTLNGSTAALTVLASGFLTPANNSNGPAFGLYYTSALGGALAPLPVVTSVSQAEAAVNTSVFPNPANGETMLEFTLNQPSDVSYRITDISGKTLMFRELGTVTGVQREVLNLNGLSAGIYLVELNTTNGRTVQRISVK